MIQRPTHVRYLVLAALCAAAMIAYIHRSCISVPAKTIQEKLNLTKSEMGQIMGVFFLGYTLFQIPGGWLGDRWGTRLGLTLFMLVWSTATGSMGLAAGFVPLLALWLVSGMAQAGIFPCSVKTIGHWFPASERGFPSGMLGSFMSIGAVIASALTGFMLDYFDWRMVFLLLALPGLLFAAVFFGWFRNHPTQHPWVNEAEIQYIERETKLEQAGASSPCRTDWQCVPRESDPRESVPRQSVPQESVLRQPVTRESPPWRSLASSYPLYLICTQQFFRAACYIFYVTWFPTFLQESWEVSKSTSGLLTALALVGVVLGSAGSGLLIDWIWKSTGSLRFSRQGVGLVSVVGAGTFLVLAFFMQAVGPAVACIIGSAFCAGLSGPAGYTITIDLAGKHVATVFSIMNMGGNLGASVLPPSVGLLAERQYWDAVLLILAGLYFVAAACWILLFIQGNITPIENEK